MNQSRIEMQEAASSIVQQIKKEAELTFCFADCRQSQTRMNKDGYCHGSPVQGELREAVRGCLNEGFS